ncbi:unnamed protein product [Paramecium octaurelia]|uniref:Uncharacterized protein n=1 Tax=Paramecium octaurelia TaxID=43137 RepID=A0A8S1UE21_PAROT|nr:unnamed protein product [Paramecium octaurelia]
MISCQQNYQNNKQNDDETINNKIDIINQLFKQMNLKKKEEIKETTHTRNITSDSIEIPIYEVPVKPQQLNKTSSEFQSYLKRKQQAKTIDRVSEFNNQENQLEVEKDEDLLTEIRPFCDQSRNTLREYSFKPNCVFQQHQSNQTLKLSTLQSQQQSCSQLRNKTDNTIDINSHKNQLCKNMSHRDMNKAQKNKQIIEQAYETFVEKKPASKSPGIKQQQQLNLLKNNFKHKINQLLSSTPEKKFRLQATIKKNYFIN